MIPQGKGKALASQDLPKHSNRQARFTDGTKTTESTGPVMYIADVCLFLNRVSSRWLTFCLLLALASVANAQQTVPLQMTEARSCDECSPTTIDASSSQSDAGFWFLSTQQSPQSFTHAWPQFVPQVQRYDDHHGFRGSDFHELTSSLIPGVPVCIMVHGSFVDVPSACLESTYTYRWLKSAGMGQQMQMIYFNWPSYKRILPTVQWEVNQLGRRAARNGYYIAELIQYIPAECPICLIGHSHGTRVIAGGLHLMAGGTLQGIGHPWARTNGRHIRTVFVASAIDRDWLNQGHKYDRALCSTECLLNMRNELDPALMIYPLRLPLISKGAIGYKGLSNADRMQLGVRSRQVIEYDVTQAIGRSHLWPYYFTKPGLSMAMRNYVYFPDRVPSTTTSDISIQASRN